ncbi:MAG: DUF547 domain-containing protein [Gammaproteobacteria bacterium]
MPISLMFSELIGGNIVVNVLLLSSVLLTPISAQAQNWQMLDEVLAQYVAPAQRQGVILNAVDYKGLSQDLRYPQIISQIENYPLQSLNSREEQLAFYINAYNVYAIKVVIENYPVESIRDVGSLFSSVWTRTAGSIGGKALSLDDIEHETLRKLGEPRMHFAIVCASLSCPNLRNEAYTAEKLDQQLEDQTRTFLNNETKGLVLDAQRVRVSQIFDWFEEDFDASGGVETFIRRYRELPARINLRANLPYNWDLNEQ